MPLPVMLGLLAAAPPPIAVVDVDSPPSMVGLASQVTRTAEQHARALGGTVLGPDQLRPGMDPRRYQELKSCAGKVACVAKALEGTPVVRVVTGQLARDERNYLLKLWLIDLPSLSVVADVDRPILIAARRFQKDLDEAIPRLLRGEKEARGQLTIDSNVKEAKVTVNGSPAGTVPVTLTLRPGKYEVKLERDRYLPVTRLVAVEADTETTETIRLLLRPGELPDEPEALPPMAARAGPAAESAPRRIGPATWITGAVALVALGVGLPFGLMARDGERQLQDSYLFAFDLYLGTRAQALEARSNALWATVAFSVAGAAALATVILVTIDLVVGGKKVTVTPAATPGGAALMVGGTL